MNYKRNTMKFALGVVAGLAVTSLSLLGSASLESLPLFMQLGVPFLLGIVTFLLILSSSLQAQEDSRSQNAIAQILGVLIIMLLGGASWFSIQSLWVDPFDSARNRFVLENIATGATAIAAILTLVLSTLQKDIFWFSKSIKHELDERQIKERQVVFEKSYKFSVWLAVVVLWGYMSSVGSIDQIKALHGFSTVPGHYAIPAYCLVIALFALPLIIAAWNKRSK